MSQRHGPTRPSASPTPMIRHDRWLMAATLAVLTMVLLRAQVGQSPDIYLAADPRSDLLEVGQTLVLGPASTAWVHVLSVLVAGCALGAHVISGGRLRRVVLALGFIGMIPAAVHMPEHIDSLTLGAGWISAVSLALAGAHLAERERPRRLMAAALAAMLATFVVRAGLYVFVEHRQTVDLFRANEAQFLQARGWEKDSPQHLLYVRRLLAPDAIGVFGMSNVFGSLAGALALLAGAMARGAGLPDRGKWRRWGVPALLAVAGVATLLLTRSRGAIGATLLSAGVLVLLLGMRARPWLGRLVVPVMMMLPVLVVGVVLVRGALGPPATAEGERSLLFRHQYWSATARMIAAEPVTNLAQGIGPGRYRDAYVRHKSPLSPEDVTSSHNVAIDLVAMLGIGGAAWVGLLGWWLWRAGVGAAGDREEAPAASSTGPAAAVESGEVLRALILGLVLYGIQFGVQFDALVSLENYLPWAAGGVAFIVATAALSNPACVEDRWVRRGLMLGALVLWVHNQIDVTFVYPGADAMAWFMVAVAGGAGVLRKDMPATRPQSPASPVDRHRLTLARLAPAAAMVVLAVALAWCYARPVFRQQAAAYRAAQLIHHWKLDQAARSLDDAIAALPIDPRIVRWRVQVALEWGAGRQISGQPGQSGAVIRDGLAVLDHARTRGLDDLSLWRLRAQVHEAGWSLAGDPAHLAAAADAWRDVVERDPCGISAWMNLGHACWKIGRHDLAAAAYRRCLELSASSYLDPARQLPTSERQLLEQRITTPAATTQP